MLLPKKAAFHHLDQGKGLSQGTSSFISKESKGFVWIASIDGLNRFDGLNVKVYRPDLAQQHSLVGNNVTSSCFEDPQTSNLWFTTNDAIHRYMREQDHFDTFQLKNQSGERIIADYYAFHLDQKGHLWLRVGTEESSTLHIWNTVTGKDSIVCPLAGLRCAVIPDNTGTIKQILCSEFPSRQTGLAVIDLVSKGLPPCLYFSERNSAFQTHEVFVENDTLVWLGTSNGIAAFNPQNGKYIVYNDFSFRKTAGVWSAYPYGSRLLMVGTEANGLWVFDRQKRCFIQTFEHEPNNPFSLQDNSVVNVIIDRQENLWVANRKTGLSYVNLRKNKFYVPAISRGNTVWRIQSGPDGNVWCTAQGKGITIYSPNGGVIDSVRNNSPKINPKLSFSNQFLYQKEGPGYITVTTF